MSAGHTLSNPGVQTFGETLTLHKEEGDQNQQILSVGPDNFLVVVYPSVKWVKVMPSWCSQTTDIPSVTPRTLPILAASCLCAHYWGGI
jgi:hypothetical protein